jgi:hypothetical protein
MDYVYEGLAWLTNLQLEAWRWFSSLSQQEWMVVLGIAAVLGFLCMKNFTQRGTL